MDQNHPDQDHHERIRQRAHEIWEREGRPEGMDADHWSRAEQELRNRMGDDRQDTGDDQPELSQTPAKPKRARKAAGTSTHIPKAARARRSGKAKADTPAQEQPIDDFNEGP